MAVDLQTSIISKKVSTLNSSKLNPVDYHVWGKC